MNTSLHILKSHFYDQLKGLYPENEIRNFMYMAFEHVLGFSKIDALIKENESIDGEKVSEIHSIIKELSRHRPIQYILGQAHFYGLQLKVNENVLIPRQETEELVELIITSQKTRGDLKIIDLGTGSGCIAIALKKYLPHADVYAVDISDKAIALAAENASLNMANIEFYRADILDKNCWNSLPQVDIIVSNPPYIPIKEKAEMDKNVIDNEPHIALFTPYNSPLLFYENIANFALINVIENGKLFFEVHENYANEVKNLLENKSFMYVKIHKDMSGKNRMVSCIKP